MADRELSGQLSAVARQLSSQGDVALTMDKALAVAVEMIDGCDAAAVSLIARRRGIETLVATDEVATRGDVLQSELAEGPCLDAAWRSETVSAPDLATDARWPTWGPRVAEELGIHSMLCFQLFVTEDSLGALNLYSQRPHAFTQHDHVDGLALAAQVAVALVAAREIDQLNAAVVSRTVIGQAQGIVMERFGVNAEQAFAVLRRLSSHSNQKLHQVAADIVRTRQIPDAPARATVG